MLRGKKKKTLPWEGELNRILFFIQALNSTKGHENDIPVSESAIQKPSHPCILLCPSPHLATSRDLSQSNFIRTELMDEHLI